MAMASGFREPTLDEMQALIEEHWRRHAKAYLRQIQAENRVEETARVVAKETQEYARLLIAGGMSPAEAWSQAQREIALALI